MSTIWASFGVVVIVGLIGAVIALLTIAGVLIWLVRRAGGKKR